MLRRIAIGISSISLVAVLAACSSGNTALSSGGNPGIGPNFTTGSAYVTNSTQNAISIYPPNATSASTPINQIGGSNTQMNGPQYAAFDAKKQIYVTNFSAGAQSGAITIYASQATGNVLPVGVITGNGSGLGSPRGIFIDSTSQIWVSNVGPSPGFASSILTYSGAPSPSGAITGSNTGLNYPTGIVIDAKGLVYVANTGSSTGSGTITVYTPIGATSSNLAPSSTIAGPLTGLMNPTGIALDGANNIYVADKTTNKVSVFAAGANGNVAPIRTITSALINNPSDLKFDSSSNLWVVNTASGSGTGSLLVFAPGASGAVAPTLNIAAPGNVVGIAFSP
ncbi:MAG: hypothetical protein NVSMB31_08240 [Vulcanimicrobiaceae bacterium]